MCYIFVKYFPYIQFRFFLLQWLRTDKIIIGFEPIIDPSIDWFAKENKKFKIYNQRVSLTDRKFTVYTGVFQTLLFLNGLLVK